VCDFCARLYCRQSYPFGQLPILDIVRPGGESYTLAQSNTIMRYIGHLRRGGVYPQDPLQACRCDEVRSQLHLQFCCAT
jgi:glutathione S-transferase